MAKQWTITRHNFYGDTRVSESRIHLMRTETMTKCGIVIEPENMKAISQDCEWFIGDIELFDFPDSSVSCRKCRRF